MGAKFTEQVYLPGVEEELLKLYGKKIIVGPATDEGSELAMYAAANEFGVNSIKPKSGTYLAIPLIPELKGISPRNIAGLVFFPGKNGKLPYLAHVEGGRVTPCYVLLREVRIPERSYLRGTFDSTDAIDKAVNMAAGAINRIIAGTGKADDVLNAMGSSLVASIKLRIRSGVGDKNSDITVATKRRKGVTLVDSGRLMQSIQYEVIS